MPVEKIDLRENPERMEEAVCRTADALRCGKLVVFPTETVYGLAARASDESAVRRLIELKGRREGHPLPLALSGINLVHDFVPDLDGLAYRLARRCWPGSVSLVLSVSDRGSEFHRLPKSVQSVVVKDMSVSFRVPSHPLALTVLGDLNEPIILTSANRTGNPEPIDSESIIAELGAGIDLLIDEGPTGGLKPSTVVRADKGQYHILREGLVKNDTIQRLAAKMILFVCTGNTCRSPMAERICEKVLSERLHCSISDLEQRGYVVLSAGVAADYEAPASAHTVEVMARQGLDLTDHRSQQINEMLVRFADHIFTMTRGHREAILSYWPSSDTRLSVLRTDGRDISDPIGGSLSVYESCTNQIEQEIRKRLDEIL